jgi:hypothetical protein
MAYDGDDEGPGFLTMFLLLGGLGVGGWLLYNMLTGQAQAAASLPATIDPTTGLTIDPTTGLAIDPTTGALVDPSTVAPIDTSSGAPAIVNQGDPSLPAGIRNNNPTNIKWNAANAWEGQIGADPSGYAVFSDAVYGLRAAFMTLKTYAGRLGSGFTIANIGPTWTSGDPPATQAGWVAAVEAVSAIPRAQPISVTNPGQMQALVNGMVAAENGQAYIGYYAGTVPQAWAMA